MFCRFCGKNINDDSIFCEGCGRNLKEQAVEAAYTPEPSQNEGFDDNTIGVWDSQPQFQQPSQEKTVKKQKTKTLDTPLANKKIKTPYILLPIAVIIAGIMAISTGVLGDIIIDVFDMRDFMGMYGDLYYGTDAYYIVNAITDILQVFVYFGVIALFSLCCKGVNKKIRFIISGYAGILGHIISMVLTAIIGYIILEVTCFFYDNSVFLYHILRYVCLYIGLIPAGLLSLFWFSSSEKHQINRSEKSKAGFLIGPIILLIVHAVISFFSNTQLQRRLFGIFEINSYGGVRRNIFLEEVSGIIVDIILFTILILFSLACKGGYKKLIFVGSVLFTQSVISSIIYAINDGVLATLFRTWFGDGFLQLIIHILTIPVTVVIYILMNRYVIEKIEKKKA